MITDQLKVLRTPYYLKAGPSGVSRMASGSPCAFIATAF